MRYLGLDYGHKRIGVAFSDEEGRIAFPLAELPEEFEVFSREIRKIIKEKQIEKIIVGVPIPFGGKDSLQTRAVRAFGEKLKEAIHVPVEFENEVLTTKLAERYGTSDKKKIDSAAAAIILQSYLDKIKSEARNPKS
ncbi:MAG: hypothetical protein A2934_01495 [Candidatus Sungbacteria bacterium RIFCSPLOWO2_01_FULL_47_10]|uniref:Putative pre-16S rRNA nuclease n=1 Tax=Candidatus Sungbacteria bacterium RIFCSPLOWO2_01_FULL_47_10 TaxID=1802276 RepID=A0A1G2L5X3_9BACT|nr:MAG: hypothetical protein A2934_01495 [Candidatus Sungbacteria bacterium RIFCSPLOWO2_01_FULL_47_10]